MARVETYRSRGIPAPTSGERAVPWPYLMGQSGRGQQQLGATIEQTAKGLLADYVDDKTAEEMNNLDVNLINGWGAYENWAQTHPDNPDIDAEEFGRHAATWRAEYIRTLTPGLPKQIGERRFKVFEAQKKKQAIAQATRQQRINAEASFVADVDALTTLPDQIVTKDNITDRIESIALIHDRAAQIGAIGPGDYVKAASIRKAGRELWTNAVVTAMKNNPGDVQNLLSDPDSFLTAEDKMQLQSQWSAMRNRAKSLEEAADKALVKERFKIVSDAIDNGTADASLIYKTYKEDNNRSDAFNQAIKEARAKQFKRLDGASKPDPKTDWAKQQEGQQVVMDYWTGRADFDKEGAIDRLQKLRYEDRVLSSDEYALLRQQLDAEYSYDTTQAIAAAFGTAKRSVDARTSLWHIDYGRDELTAQIQRAILSRVDLAQTKGQPVRPLELSELAAQLAAGQSPRESAIGHEPVTNNLKQATKQKPKENLVRMRAPDGTVYEFSVEYEAEARKNGYEPVQ